MLASAWQLPAIAIHNVGCLLLLFHDLSWISGPCERVVDIDGFWPSAVDVCLTSDADCSGRLGLAVSSGCFLGDFVMTWMRRHTPYSAWEERSWLPSEQKLVGRRQIVA